MKYRSIVLGLCAVVFATGSAFTFANANLATQAYIKIISSENPALHCVQTNLECSDTGSALCTVRVEIDTAPGTFKVTDARKLPTSTCLIMKNSSALQQNFNPASETIEDVQPVGVQ